MAEFTQFEALAFDLVDGRLVEDEPEDCASPAVAIQTARGKWQVLGYAGSVAYSRTSDFSNGRFNQKHVLRRFGQVPDEYRNRDE